MGTIPYFSSASGINNYIGETIGTKIFDHNYSVSYGVSGSHIYYIDNNYIYRENDYEEIIIDKIANESNVEVDRVYYFPMNDNHGIIVKVDISESTLHDTGNIYFYDINWLDLSRELIYHYAYTPIYDNSNTHVLDDPQYFFLNIVESSIYSDDIGILMSFYDTCHADNVHYGLAIYKYSDNIISILPRPSPVRDGHLLSVQSAISPGNGKICFLVQTYLYDWFYEFISGYIGIVDIISKTVSYMQLPEDIHNPGLIGDYSNEPYDLIPNFDNNTLLVLTKYHYSSGDTGALYYYKIYECTYFGSMFSVYQSSDEWDTASVANESNKLFYSNNQVIACRYYAGNLYFYDLSNGAYLFSKAYYPYTAMSSTIDESDNSIIYFEYNGTSQHRLIKKIYLSTGNDSEIIDVNSISGMPDMAEFEFYGIHNLRLVNNFINYGFYSPDEYYYTIVHYNSSGSIIFPSSQGFQIIWWGGD
jgi:hypothetical protein